MYAATQEAEPGESLEAEVAVSRDHTTCTPAWQQCETVSKEKKKVPTTHTYQNKYMMKK